jgi:hypothetical protein
MCLANTRLESSSSSTKKKKNNNKKPLRDPTDLSLGGSFLNCSLTAGYQVYDDG